MMRLAHSLDGMLPPVLDNTQFHATPNQWREAGRVFDAGATVRRAFLQDLKHFNRFGYAPYFLRTLAFANKTTANQSVSNITNDDLFRFRQCLEAAGNGSCLADNRKRVDLTLAHTGRANDDHPGVNRHPG